MSSQFLHFPDYTPLEVEEEEQGIFSKFSLKLSGLRRKMSDTSRANIPPISRSSSSSSAESHSSRASSTQEDTIPLIMTEDDAPTPARISGEAPRYGSHRRAVSQNDIYKRNNDAEWTAAALYEIPSLPHPGYTPDLDQLDSKLQRRGAQRKSAPPPLRLRPSKSNQSLEILQPSPRSCHKTPRFLELDD